MFNAMLISASLFGAVAWACNVQNTNLQATASSLNNASVLNGTLRPTSPDRLFQIKRLAAESNRWSGSFFVFSALEFSAVSSSQLLILDRLLTFVSKSSRENMQRLYGNAFKFAFAVVAVCNAVGVCANTAAAVDMARSSSLFDSAANAYAARDLAEAQESNRLAEDMVFKASEKSSIQVRDWLRYKHFFQTRRALALFSLPDSSRAAIY